MTTCTFQGCERKPAYPDQSRCESHRLRWVAREPVHEPRIPAWVERMALNAKELSGGRAA